MPGYDAKGVAIAGPTTKVPRWRRNLVKDQNALKKSMLAYLLYQNSLMPEEKGQWEAHTTYDKERYDQEMVHYIPPPGYNAQGVLINNCKYSCKAKKQTDQNAPKCTCRSFAFFPFEMRPRILKEFPGIKFVEMGTMMGEWWCALPPAEKNATKTWLLQINNGSTPRCRSTAPRGGCYKKSRLYFVYLLLIYFIVWDG
eukprot:1618634-Ditylum_brightwellii.AAC.1